MEKYTRNCPKCNREIEYTTKFGKNRALKRGNNCLSCATTEKFNKFPELRKGVGDRARLQTGDKNPFYGKKHTKEVIEKISSSNKNKVRSEGEIEKSRQILKEHNRNNLHISNYDLWLQKYGKDEADKRQTACAAKHSANNSGKSNPMYGRPSPRGSGNGWKGWYKDVFFRSLRELSFILWLEDNNLQWESGESRKIQIKYIDWDNKERNYFPDFLVENRIYEIKPKKLWDTPNVSAKKLAAEKYCAENGYEYILLDQQIDTKRLIRMYKNKEIKFSGKYDKKFEEYISKEPMTLADIYNFEVENGGETKSSKFGF